MNKPKFAFEPHWSFKPKINVLAAKLAANFKPKINVLAAKLAANYRYNLLIGTDKVSASFGPIHSVLEVKVRRHLKRKF